MSANTGRSRWNGVVPTPQDQFLAKRRILLREAGRAFSENGFHNTTLEDVATRLNITKTAFYHYFKNKDDLLRECCKVGFSLGYDALDQAARSEAATSALEELIAFVKIYGVAVAREIGACAVMSELKSLPVEDLKSVMAQKRDFDRRLRLLFERGIEDGSIAQVDSMMAVNWLMGALTTMPRWYSPDGRLAPEQVGETFAEFARRTFANASLSEPRREKRMPGQPRSGIGSRVAR